MWQSEDRSRLVGRAAGADTKFESIAWRVLSTSPADGWWAVERATARPGADGRVAEQYTALAVACWAVIEERDESGDRWQLLVGMVDVADGFLWPASRDARYVRGEDPQEAYDAEQRETFDWVRSRPAHDYELRQAKPS